MVQGRKTNPVVFPTPEERRILESRQRSTTIGRGLARRGQIILMLSDGALNLFAAFNTRTGQVIGRCRSRERQKELISFLDHVDREIPPEITLIHIVRDNVGAHHGKEVQKWLKKHPRFQFHFTPVHCSWMNQVEQWFGILQRKRFRFADFPSKETLNESIMQFISEWNKHAHPFNRSTKSAAKIMAGAPVKKAA